ncbi:MAG TPA: hypothetical protein VIX42_04735 [Edaphobacter sp.]
MSLFSMAGQTCTRVKQPTANNDLGWLIHLQPQHIIHRNGFRSNVKGEQDILTQIELATKCSGVLALLFLERCGMIPWAMGVVSLRIIAQSLADLQRDCL